MKGSGPKDIPRSMYIAWLYDFVSNYFSTVVIRPRQLTKKMFNFGRAISVC